MACAIAITLSDKVQWLYKERCIVSLNVYGGESLVPRILFNSKLTHLQSLIDPATTRSHDMTDIVALDES